MSAEQLSMMKADPARFENLLVAFEGKVIHNTYEAGQGQFVQLLVSNPVSTNVVVARLPFDSAAVVAEGENAKLLGYVDKRVEGINGFGGVTDALSLRGIAIQTPYGLSFIPSKEPIARAWGDGELFQGVRGVPPSGIQ